MHPPARVARLYRLRYRRAPDADLEVTLCEKIVNPGKMSGFFSVTSVSLW